MVWEDFEEVVKVSVSGDVHGGSWRDGADGSCGVYLVRGEIVVWGWVKEICGCLVGLVCWEVGWFWVYRS